MSTATTAATAVTYSIDPAHSSVGFKIRHFMIAYVRGGFSGVTGEVIVDAANPSNSKINASIDVNTLHTYDVKRDAHVKTPDFLDAEKNPTMTFVSKKVVADGKNQWKVTGDLTLRGVTKEVTFQGYVTFNRDGSLNGRAKTTFNWTTFGLTKPAIARLMSVSDDIELDIVFRFKRS